MCTLLLLIPDSGTRGELLGFPAKTFELGGPALGSVQRLPLEHLLPRVLVVRVVDLPFGQIQIINVADTGCLSRILDPIFPNRILDPNFPNRIPDPGSKRSRIRIRIKELKYF